MSLLALILCPDTRSSGLTLARNSLATRHHLIPGWQSRAMAGDNDLISSVNTQICNCCNARTARFTRMAVLASNKVVRSIFPIVITDMRGGGYVPPGPGAECVAISGIVTLWGQLINYVMSTITPHPGQVSASVWSLHQEIKRYHSGLSAQLVQPF